MLTLSACAMQRTGGHIESDIPGLAATVQARKQPLRCVDTDGQVSVFAKYSAQSTSTGLISERFEDRIYC